MPPTRGYRRSKAERPRGKPIQPHFFKIFQPTIRSNKLLISAEFVAEFGDELSSIAILTVPNGRTWRVGIQKAGENFWFRDGWQKFVDYYSISFGYCLVFRYEGNSKFHVMIFNNVSGYQIEYPIDENLGSDLDAADDDEDVEPPIPKKARRKSSINIDPHISFSKRNIESSTCKGECSMSRKGKQKLNEIPAGERYFSVKQEVEEPFLRKSSSCTETRSGNLELDDRFKKEIRKASKQTLQNPSFRVTFKRHNRSYLYVPADFSIKYLWSTSESVTLEAPSGEKFLVNFYHNASGSREASKRFGKGWLAFTRKNNLEEGDVCVFELINNRTINIAFKVRIYRSSG